MGDNLMLAGNMALSKLHMSLNHPAFCFPESMFF
jgi:hypothetical protein